MCIAFSQGHRAAGQDQGEHPTGYSRAVEAVEGVAYGNHPKVAVQVHILGRTRQPPDVRHASRAQGRRLDPTGPDPLTKMIGYATLTVRGN